mgnify:CR=1 FL=1
MWDEVNGGNTMEKASVGVMIGGGIVTAASTAAMVAGLALPAKTTFTYHSSYDIYVYDTVDKEVVYKKTVTVEPVSDEFTGSYETAGLEVNDALSKYYNQMAYNALMRTYSTLSVKEF